MTNNNYYNYDCNNNHNTSNNNHNGNINAFSCNFNIESNFLYCTSVRQLLRQRLINVEPAVVCGLHILLVHGLRTAVPCISCCWWRHLPCYLSWPLPSVWFLQHILSLSATGCSLNIVFFSKDSRKFATTSPSLALVCYWLYKKLPANKSDCTLVLRLELWRGPTAM